jgi:hypothetical protein
MPGAERTQSSYQSCDDVSGKRDVADVAVTGPDVASAKVVSSASAIY